MAVNGGEVVYTLVADDGNLDSDLDKANKKVEKATKESADKTVKIEEEKTKEIKQESEKVTKSIKESAEESSDSWKKNSKEIEDSVKDTGEEIEDVLGEDVSKLTDNLGQSLREGFASAAESAIPLLDKVGKLTAGLSGTTAAMIGVGVAAAGAGVLAVGAANDMQGAMNGFLAETGKGKEELDRYQTVLEDIYANNYGDSFEDIASAMADITKTLGDMDDATLQNVTESAFALRDTFEYDIQESTRAAKAMMDNFGISGEEAMSMIAAGAQNGLDYSRELLDSISEYSVQFEKMGFSADDMFKIFQKGAESGAFNLDKVGDAVKEFSIRAIDGSDTTIDGFTRIGLNADEMAAKFAAGGDNAKEAFKQTIDALAAIEDPLEQNTAGVDLFGTMWEDLGPEAVAALAEIEDGAYDTADAMNQIKDVKYDDLGSMFEELKRNVELLAIPIGEALIPVLSILIESILPVVTDLLGPLTEMFALLIEPIAGLIGTAIQPLIEALVSLITITLRPLISILDILLGVFSAVMSSISGTVTGEVNNITNIFRNLLDFIKNVFTGNWSGAWNNIKNIFSEAVSGLAGIFKAPINAIIDGWNSLASSFGSVTVPEWVPGIGGGTWSLPRMTRLKVGLDYVPTDMFPAYLDEGEWVLTKEEADALRSLGGIEGVLSMLGHSGSVSKQSIVVQNAGANIDYDALGTAVAEALIDAGIGFKCDEHVFARLIKDLIDYA